ncbi:MAG: MarR family transcriptional regulator [Nevskia sp.]|nr:MarR family transcriptional regulator [Nevskia sp.]
MKGIERLSAVESSTPRMTRALPDMPMAPTIMVRLIRISAFGMGNFFEPVFRSLGTSEHAFHALCLLVASEKGMAAPSELSEMIGTSRANTTRIVEELVQDGLVTRSVHARDARRHEIAITAAGRKRVREIVPRMVEPLERAFSGLSNEEFRLLDRLLRKLIVSLDNSARAMSSAA